MIKKEIRVIGIDDSPFEKFSKGKVVVVGVVMRGGSWVDGILSSKVDIDGSDSTKRIIDMVLNSKFRPQLRCIFLDGIAVAGFNVVNVQMLHEETQIPVIVVIRKRPDMGKIAQALGNLSKTNRLRLIKKAGNIIQIGKIYVQLAGIDMENASKMLSVVCTRSLIPEPLRLAHLIASGMVKGESKGRA